MSPATPGVRVRPVTRPAPAAPHPGLAPLRPASGQGGQLPQEGQRPVLVVSYSRSGRTRGLAQQIASQCGADLDDIVDRTDRSGWIGYLRSAAQALLGLEAPIADSRRSPQDYALVIVGTPVWAGSMASPVRSYLKCHHGQFRRVAYFCTFGGSGADRVLRTMAELGGRPAAAALAVSAHDFDQRLHGRRLGQFVRILRNGRRASAEPVQSLAA